MKAPRTRRHRSGVQVSGGMPLPRPHGTWWVFIGSGPAGSRAEQPRRRVRGTLFEALVPLGSLPQYAVLPNFMGQEAFLGARLPNERGHRVTPSCRLRSLRSLR